MIEKVNPSHPDKIADRIAGAIVDLAYKKQDNPKIAVEILIGHDECKIITETSVHFTVDEISDIVYRISGIQNKFDVDNNEDVCTIDYTEVPQDEHLAKNQETRIKCGDNGIFKGVPISAEEETLSGFARILYKKYPTDGKFILDDDRDTFIGCQSNISQKEFEEATTGFADNCILNPLGDWTGGIDVDTGATNRKLGSDMGRAVTGGGLHGKDLSKADVSVNIACHILAQARDSEVEACCAIGDDEITFRCKKDGEKINVPYSEVVEQAREFVNELGGFEKLAEWGLF